ncbi:hypothetical protein WICPIJ_000033 [Wickerhamomyces pijperi]|uniref:Uncharacterized protein n=1 Tax=Wickerhamomyces pijperi TaxID=599730 RepID=A0A9P8QIG8_WICPI|nr:hypothetical protein WICPIJ_000033 [Wickerhamomyces pijperi]
MTKISELEGKMSDLIQENLAYRDAQAKAEDLKRKWLAEKLALIEESTLQRFEEMFQMFANIRANEGLPSSKISLSNLVDLTNSPTSDKTVSFDSIKTPKKNAAVSERRRKSSRRQSFYVPPQPDTDEVLFKGDIPSLPAQSQEDQSQAVVNTSDVSVNDSSVTPEQPLIDNVESSNENETEQYTREIYKSPLKTQRKMDDGDDIMRILDIPGMYQSAKQLESTTTPQLKPREDTVSTPSPAKRPLSSSDASLLEADSQISLSSALSPVKLSPPKILQLSIPKLQVYKDKVDSPILRPAASTTDPITPSSPVKKKPNQRNAVSKPAPSSPVKSQSTVAAVPASPVKKQNKKASTTALKQAKKNTVLSTSEDNDSPILKVEPLDDTPVVEEQVSQTQTKTRKRKASNAFADELEPSTPAPAMVPSIVTTPVPTTSTGRPSRTRGNRVSYVQPPLRSKLRRESERFVAAVAENAFFDFNKSTTPKETSLGATPIATPEPQTLELKTPKSTPKSLQSFVAEPTIATEVNKSDEVASAQTVDNTEEPTEDSVPIKAAEQPTSTTTEQPTRRPLSALNKNKKNNKPREGSLELKPLVRSLAHDMSVFDLVEESAVGVPKTYRNEIGSVPRKKSTGRRNSSLL